MKVWMVFTDQGFYIDVFSTYEKASNYVDWQMNEHDHPIGTYVITEEEVR